MKFRRILDIAPLDANTALWNVIVETPRGSRHKYKYDPENNAFSLHRTMPEGMTFPFDFGFLPRTAGQDGDPLDVLVLLQDGSFTACMVTARLVGVIEATQTERGGKEERNDRLVAIASTSRDESDIHSAKQLNGNLLREVEEFFITYNRLDGKRFKVLRVRGPRTAEKLARAGMRQFKKNQKSEP